AFDLRADLADLEFGHLDADVEAEFHVGDLGLQHRFVMRRIDLLEVLQSVDQPDEALGVADRLEHLLARRFDGEFARNVHGIRETLDWVEGKRIRRLRSNARTGVRRMALSRMRGCAVWGFRTANALPSRRTAPPK